METGNATVVGVTLFHSDEAGPSIPTFQIDPQIDARQKRRVSDVRASRSGDACRTALDRVRTTAFADANLVPPIIAAVEASATIGEISDTLRVVFGEHQETSTL